MGSIRIRNSEKVVLYPDYIILDSQHDFWRVQIQNKYFQIQELFRI